MIDKTQWFHKNTGPWDDEVSGKQWFDETTGLPCLIRRTPLGHLCGYVGLPSNHPWHGKPYSRIRLDVNVHGNLTYAGKTPDDFALPGYWWIGFDCSHSFDLVPGMRINYAGEYRTIAYVKAECTSLAIAANNVETL